MLSAVFSAPGVLELQERPRPVPADHEVLLEVEGCGVCGTDLHILDVPAKHPATKGVILGHEFLGRIVDTGSAVRSLSSGTRIAVAPNIACGSCHYCRAGLFNHCRDFTTLGIFRDGGLARWAVAPESACHPISDSVPFQDAIWTELLSCVMNSISNIKPLPGETAVVIGAGPVGALHCMLLQASHTRVIVSDILDSRLEVLSRLGVKTFNTRRTSLQETVEKEWGWGADLVIDAVGNQFQTAIDVVRVGGRISLFGMDSRAQPAITQNSITRKELLVFGSYVGSHTFPRAIAVLESQAIRPSQLVSRVVHLAELPETIQQLRAGRLMKAVVKH